MNKKKDPQPCALVLLADGFDETEVVVLLSTFRKAGLCIKTVGLTHGLLKSSSGIALLPDVTLSDAIKVMDIDEIDLVILTGEAWHLARLAQDPRVHQFLRQVVSQEGMIVTAQQGMSIVKIALGEEENHGAYVLLWDRPAESVESFSQDLVRRMRVE